MDGRSVRPASDEFFRRSGTHRVDLLLGDSQGPARISEGRDLPLHCVPLFMSSDEEVRILKVCTTPRFLSEIVPLVGLPERRCREQLQSVKTRKLVRLLHRRWSTTRAGERYMQELAAEAEAKEREVEAKRRKMRGLAAPLRARIETVREEVEAVESECKEIPLASSQSGRIEIEVRTLRSLQRRVDSAPNQESLKKLDRVLKRRLPRATVLARETHAQVANLGLFEVLRLPDYVDDPIWLLCSSCHEMQAQPTSWHGRYKCIECKRRGRPFVPSQKSIRDYVLPPFVQPKKLDVPELLLRSLRIALAAGHWPSPVAEGILNDFKESSMTEDGLYFACRLSMGEYGARMIVWRVFGMPSAFPSPMPSRPR